MKVHIYMCVHQVSINSGPFCTRAPRTPSLTVHMKTTAVDQRSIIRDLRADSKGDARPTVDLESAGAVAR